MSGKDLSEAMGGIADEKIESAIHAYEKKGTRRNVWFRVAAVAAMLAIVLTVALWPRQSENGEIITAPGIMKVYGYDWEESQNIDALEKYELTSNEDYFRMIYFAPLSANIKSTFTFEVPEDYFGDAVVTFDVSCEYKEFCDDITVDNRKGIVFDSWELVKPLHEIGKEVGNGNFYLDIVIRADGNIVGYGVIAFCFYKDGQACKAYWFKTVCFPLVDGQYQDVSEEYVWEQIAQCKQEKENSR